MTRFTLIHPSLNKMGGAEKVLLEMIRVLNENGYQTILYTVDCVNWEKLEKKWGTQHKPEKEASYLRESSFSSFLDWGAGMIIYLWMLWRVQQEGGITLNNYGEVFPILSDISYIHSHPMYTNNGNAYNLPLWPHSGRLYKWLFDILRHKTSPVIVSNSKYTAGKVQSMGLKSNIIYPFVEPVKVTAYKRGDVLTVSRITWGKNLDTLFKVASLCRGVRFRVTGEVSPNALNLVKEIKRSRRFTFSANPTKEDIERAMAESSIYFSTQPNETFGMAIAEAMSAGCVPVVYRGGGPWMDILGEKEEVGLSYGNVEEAAEKIQRVLRNEEERNKMRLHAVERAKELSVERFERSILDLIGSCNPKARSESRLVRFLRWMTEKREEFGL